MKIYPEIVRTILENARSSGEDRISLVDVIWKYDEKNKLAPLLEEINEALRDIDWISLSWDDKELFLIFKDSHTASVSVTKEDFKWADNEYRRRFSKALKKLSGK
ncbi:MAG: hypothetical protein WC855_12975 [Thermodesulfovibrionales bacterium]